MDPGAAMDAMDLGLKIGTNAVFRTADMTNATNAWTTRRMTVVDPSHGTANGSADLQVAVLSPWYCGASCALYTLGSMW